MLSESSPALAMWSSLRAATPVTDWISLISVFVLSPDGIPSSCAEIELERVRCCAARSSSRCPPSRSPGESRRAYCAWRRQRAIGGRVASRASHAAVSMGFGGQLVLLSAWARGWRLLSSFGISCGSRSLFHVILTRNARYHARARAIFRDDIVSRSTRGPQ